MSEDGHDLASLRCDDLDGEGRVAGHAFWEETDPQARAMQRLQFAKNTSVLGGLLLAGVDTEGRPGLAWRARRAAKDVRREAKQVAKAARHEARLAKAQLT